jgi:outer membrane protein TolC
LQSQPLLTPEDAVQITLKNNYNILTARNNADIDKINNTIGNAGMLPTIAINGSDNYSQNNVNLQLSNGSNIENANGSSSNLNANLALNWTLFDGGKMFVTKKKLNEIETLGEFQFKEKVLQSVYDVIVAYYGVVEQKQQLESVRQVINYNSERVKILETSFQAGLTPKTNLLQAKIDLNVYRENAINQEFVIVEAKRVLNEILARDSDASFEVVDSIPLNFIPDKEDLVKKLYQNNTSILSSQKQLDIARLSLKEYYTLGLPKLYFNAGYNFLQIDNTASNVVKNHSYGPTIGATVFVPIFQAGLMNRQLKIAKLQIQSAEYDFENTKIFINVQLQNALTDFENQQNLYLIEKDNAKLAKENLDISMARLRLGQTTSLELRQAQESFEDSNTRLLNFQYNLKIAETKLKQIISNL